MFGKEEEGRGEEGEETKESCDDGMDPRRPVVLMAAVVDAGSRGGGSGRLFSSSFCC